MGDVNLMLPISLEDRALLLSQVTSHLDGVSRVIADDIGRIAWNSFLALLPLTLSFWLFYRPHSRVFCWSIYTLLGVSFGVGIKKYNDGNFLEAIKRIGLAVWGFNSVFVTLAIGSIGVLLTLALSSKWVEARHRSPFWWVGLLAFITFLPNAPYILTDIVHFYEAVRTLDSVWTITLIIVPIYVLFIGVGWLSYVFSLINVERHLIRYHLKQYISLTEILLHLLCSIGIYIGRFIRFNSWSLLTQPKQLLSILPGELIGKFPIVVILITFLIITILYSISKQIVIRLPIYEER